VTQDDLADRLIQLGAGGVTGGLVSKWERGICRLSAFHPRLLYQFFEASPEQLGFAVGQTHPQPSTRSGNAVELLAYAGDAAVTARQKRSTIDPTTLESLTRTSSASPWNALASQPPTRPAGLGRVAARRAAP
jgi:hypothetical protein